MITKLLVLFDGKLQLMNFSIKLNNTKIIINKLNLIDTLIKIPIYNKYNGINYCPMFFPLELTIINNFVFNPWIIWSSCSIDMRNDLDFFYNIKLIIKTTFNLKFIELDDLDFFHKNNNLNLAKILNNNLLFNKDINLNLEISNDLIKSLWLDINLIKLYIIYILVKYPTISNKIIKDLHKKNNIPKKILLIANQLKIFKYNILTNNNNVLLNLIDYYQYDYDTPLTLPNIRTNQYYFIVINKTPIKNVLLDSSIPKNEFYDTKTIKIFVNNINENIITINNTKDIIFDNYKWFQFPPNVKIDKYFVIYQTFFNIEFFEEIIKLYFNIELIHAKKILEYYEKDAKNSNLISLSTIFNNNNQYLNDINILKSNSFSSSFFEYITKKYSSGEDNIKYEILSILFEHYNYPLKTKRRELDDVFDYIMYFSIYNYKIILITNNTWELFHPNINNNIPIKLKNLYMNLIKTLSQIINNNFDGITYNQKFYNDYLHRTIIKLFFNNSPSLTINLFKSLIKSSNYNKFKTIVSTNMLLIDITDKLTWNNLPKKLNYLNFFYKNNDIIYYQNRINKNIIPDHFDERLKKIIENPFDMFKYLRKETDFIKWAKFISDKIIQLYYVPISLSSEDIGHIGKIIYLLFNITEQNNKEITYTNFIKFCNSHNKLILDSLRINLKIKEYFPNLKSNINLGFLAKHLTWDKELITFEDEIQDKTQEVLLLEMKLHNMTKKYYKYKSKYLEHSQNKKLS